jgi:hypothetical protein
VRERQPRRKRRGKSGLATTAAALARRGFGDFQLAGLRLGIRGGAGARGGGFFGTEAFQQDDGGFVGGVLRHELAGEGAGEDGKVLPHKLPDDELAAYEGVLGHYHIRTNKVDPGPAFNWDKVIKGARRLVP